MKKRQMHFKQSFPAILAGVLVWAICMGFSVHVAWAAPGPQPVAQDGSTASPPSDQAPAETAATKACSECHPDVQSAWLDSPHAHAFDYPIFTERWKSLGEPGECLVCHTTNYSATTGGYSAEGVACEACHGNPDAEHPPAIIPTRADTEYCGSCHTTTLGEWRLTGHATADVGCKDCHNPHSQAALFENPDEMCINCHKDDIGEHKNDIHIMKDIGCVECHALVLPPETPPPDGLIPTGHTFTITPATCVSCHTDTLHIGEPLPGYEAGAKAVAATLPVTSTVSTIVEQYTGETPTAGSQPTEQTIQALEAALASSRLSTLFQGGIIGLALGGSTAFFVGRNQTRGTRTARKEEDEPDEAESNEGSQDA